MASGDSVLAGRWRPWMLSLALTIGLFWFLLSQIDPAQLLETARSMSPGHVAAFVTLLLAGVGARAVRFWLLLDRAVPLPLLGGIVMARNLFIDLLPARLGELSYVYLVTARARRPLGDAVASLFLAIVFDVIALAPLLLLAVLVVGGDAAISTPLLVGAALALALVGVGLIKIGVPMGGWIADRLGAGQPSGWRATVADLASKTVAAMRDVDRRRIFGPLLAVSMVVRLCKFGSYYFLVLAIMMPLGYTLEGLGFFRVFLGVLSAELAAALPVHGIAGFGTFEAAWALSFSQLGFSTEDAITSGILAHAVSQMVEYSLGGLALLMVLRPWRRSAPGELNWRQALERARTQPD